MQTDPRTDLDRSPGLDESDLAYLRRMTRWLSRDAEEAEDIAQETWLAYHKSPPHDPARNRQWLRVVARRIAARMRYQRDPVRVLAEEPLDPASLRTNSRRGEVQEIVGRAYRSLPEPYQSMVRMRFYEDLKPSSISERLGVSVNTVNSRLQRAQAMLRRKLEPERRTGLRWLAGVLLAPFGLGRDKQELQLQLGAWTQFAALGIALVAAGYFITSSGRGERGEPLAPFAANTLLAADPVLERAAAPTVLSQDRAPAGGLTTVAATSVQGHVIDHQGRGVQGAAVYAWIDETEARQVATAGLDGVFNATLAPTDRLRGPILGADGSIALQARAPGWSDGTVSILSPDREGDVPLVLGSESGSLLVEVSSVAGAELTDLELEYSAESADVYGPDLEGTLFWEPPARAVQQGDGRWLLDGLPVGSGTLRARARGQAPVREDLTVTTETRLVELVFVDGFELSGRVLDENDAPIAGAKVTRIAHDPLEDCSTTTNALGVFRLADLVPGRVRVEIHAQDSTLGWSTTLRLGEDEGELGDIRLRALEPHRAQLLDEAGSPLSSFVVQLRNPRNLPGWARTARTDEDGWITVENAPYETIEIWPFAGDRHPQAGFPIGSFEVGRGEPTTITVPLGLMTTWQIWSGGSAGIAPAGSFLRIRQLPKLAERRLRLPPDGRLVLEVPRGQYLLTYFEPGKGEAVLGTVDVEEGSQHRLFAPPAGRVTLGPEVTAGVEYMRLEQIFGQAYPVVLAILELHEAPASEYELLHGHYRLTLRRSNGLQDSLEFDVAPGERTTLER